MKRSPWIWAGAGAGAALIGYLAWRAWRPNTATEPVGVVAERETSQIAARREALLPLFRAAAARYGLPLSWLLAFGRKESKYRNRRSEPGQRDDELGGAWGPLQVTSETARVLGLLPRATHEQRGRAILSEPALGIELGARYLARIVGELGPQLELVAAAYNAGPERVRTGHVPHRTLTQYVPLVVAYAHEYQAVT